MNRIVSESKMSAFGTDDIFVLLAICRICASICGLSPPIKHRIYSITPQKTPIHLRMSKKSSTSTYSPLFSTGAPSNVTFAACSLYANISELINTELHSYTIMPKSALLCEHNAHYYS